MAFIVVAMLGAIGFVLLNEVDIASADSEPAITSVGGVPVEQETNVGGAPIAMVGKPYSAQVVATGEGLTYSAGAGEYMKLPAGLSIDSETGLISGTCTDETGRYNFYLTVSNAHGSASAVIGISVGSDANIPVISTAEGSLGTMKVNAIGYFTVSVQVDATYNIYGFSWSLKTGTLPTGMSLAYTSSASVQIVGTPTATGTFEFQLEAKNDCGSASKTFSITVEEGLVAPSIFDECRSELPYAVVGQPYSYQMKASGSTPLKWSFNDNDYASESYDLGNGLTLVRDTGIISGTPISSSQVSLDVIKVKNEAGSTNAGPYIPVYENGAVKSVTVSPAETAVQKTKTKQFSAEVFGYGSVDQTVTWDFSMYDEETHAWLPRPTSANTTLVNGLLTIGEDEGRALIYIVAIASDGSTKGKAVVNVLEKGAEVFTVSFDGNGAKSGTITDLEFVSGYEYTLPESTFVPQDHKKFKAWAIGSTSGEQKQPGQEITITSDVCLFAIWEDITFTVSFESDGGTGSMADVVKTEGSAYSLPENKFTPPSGKQFKCWSVNGAEKNPGDGITVTENVTVIAVWMDIPVQTYTVSFNANGGTGSMADVNGVSGQYALPANGFTAPSGKQFKCWSVNDQEKNPGDSITVTANVTVKAIWKDTVVPEPPYEEKEVDGKKVYEAETSAGVVTPVTDLFNAAKTGGGSVDIKAGDVTLSFDSDAVNAIAGKDVTLKAELKTSGTGIENAQAVIEVTLTGSTFENGKAKVAVPFTTAVPDGKELKVYYIDGNNRTEMDATYENGQVTFTTNHFSTYAIVFEDASSPSEGGFPTWIIAVIAVVVIALVAIVVLMKMGIIPDLLPKKQA